MKVTTEEKKRMLYLEMVECHSDSINHTTPRTVSYRSGGGSLNSSIFNTADSDEELKELREFVKDNEFKILEEMIFNQKEFIVNGKLQGKPIQFITKNNVTGNKVTIKYDNLDMDDKVWTEYKIIITRK